METERLLEKFTEAAREAFDPALTGVHLHGSLAMGCFCPGASDVDLIVVTAAPPGPLTPAFPPLPPFGGLLVRVLPALPGAGNFFAEKWKACLTSAVDVLYSNHGKRTFHQKGDDHETEGRRP